VLATKESMFAVQEVPLQIDPAYRYLMGFIVWVDEESTDWPFTNSSATPLPDPETTLNLMQTYLALNDPISDFSLPSNIFFIKIPNRLLVIHLIKKVILTIALVMICIDDALIQLNM
jgi:hypothetical protein